MIFLAPKHFRNFHRFSKQVLWYIRLECSNGKKLFEHSEKWTSSSENTLNGSWNKNVFPVCFCTVSACNHSIKQCLTRRDRRAFNSMEPERVSEWIFLGNLVLTRHSTKIPFTLHSLVGCTHDVFCCCLPVSTTMWEMTGKICFLTFFYHWIK